MIADFTDEMELLTCGIGRDMDIDNAALCIVDSELCCAYLRLLQPYELDDVIIRVIRM